MATTISFELADQLQDTGYFYIMHRFLDYSELDRWMLHRNKWCSISLGVQEKDRQFVDLLSTRLTPRATFITVDIAHGYCTAMEDIVKYIKKKLPDAKVIVGNFFGDKESVKFAEDIGADAIKIGLSYGAGCTTYDKTGYSSPMFTCGLEARSHTKLPLIGDGGIRSNGDIAKALVAGYTMVMAGSIFAACTDSPAEVICGKKHYYGSASARNKGHNRHVEGREVLLDFNGMTYNEKLDEIKQDLQSAISYAGGDKLSDLHEKGQICLL
jgi:GMP reductase